MLAHLSLCRSTVDFAVIDGLRTAAEQEAAFLSGHSKIRSGGTHQEGRAIDIVPWVGGKINWNDVYYIDLAAAFQKASRQLEIPVTWGAVWDRQLADLSDSLLLELHQYLDRHRGPDFIDYGHFQVAPTLAGVSAGG